MSKEWSEAALFFVTLKIKAGHGFSESLKVISLTMQLATLRPVFKGEKEEQHKEFFKNGIIFILLQIQLVKITLV